MYFFFLSSSVVVATLIHIAALQIVALILIRIRFLLCMHGRVEWQTSGFIYIMYI